MPSDVRDKAVCAVVVATVGNFEICNVRRSRQHALTEGTSLVASNVKAAFAAQRFGNYVTDIAVVVCAHHCVGFGQSVKNFLPELLSETACNNHLFAVSFGFVTCHFQYRVDGFFATAFEERTGIYDNYVGIGRVGGYFVTALYQIFQHYFGVNAVFITSQ